MHLLFTQNHMLIDSLLISKDYQSYLQPQYTLLPLIYIIQLYDENDRFD